MVLAELVLLILPQLQKQTILALNNPNFIKVNKNKAQISQLFEWYKGDFEQKGSIVDFICPVSKT